MSLYSKINPELIFRRNKLLEVKDSTGGRLLLRYQDLGVYYEIFMEEAYDLPTSMEVQYILDLGSHIGLSINYFKQKFPFSSIVGFEPDIYNFKLLKKNVRSKSVKVFNYAISTYNGEAPFSQALRGINSKVSTDGTETVQSITLESAIVLSKFEYVDILKIDIEGFEKEILNGSMIWKSKVKRIIMEYHAPEDSHYWEYFFKANGFNTFVRPNSHIIFAENTKSDF